MNSQHRIMNFCQYRDSIFAGIHNLQDKEIQPFQSFVCVNRCGCRNVFAMPNPMRKYLIFRFHKNAVHTTTMRVGVRRWTLAFMSLLVFMQWNSSMSYPASCIPNKSLLRELRVSGEIRSFTCLIATRSHSSAHARPQTRRMIDTFYPHIMPGIPQTPAANHMHMCLPTH